MRNSDAIYLHYNIYTDNSLSTFILHHTGMLMCLGCTITITFLSPLHKQFGCQTYKLNMYRT